MSGAGPLSRHSPRPFLRKEGYERQMGILEADIAKLAKPNMMIREMD